MFRRLFNVKASLFVFVIVAFAMAAIACGSQPAAPAPAPAPAQPAIDPAELSKLVQDAVKQSVPEQQSGPAPVSAQEIQSMVEAAVTAAAPEGASAEEISAMVRQAVEASSQPGASKEDIEELVTNAVSSAAPAQSGVSADEVQMIVSEAIKSIPTPTTIEVEKQVIVVATPVPAGEREFMLASPDPFPKYGGILKVEQASDPAHFDIHQSGTINNVGPQSPMYDTLLEHDPRDGGKTIIPALAARWEISADGTSYTFNLREGVKFHDGADMTSADVEATYQKIIFPPEGIASIRQGMFAAVSGISTPDANTIKFDLQEPRSSAYIFAAFAAPWNWIVRKQTLEENDADLKRIENYPGTGPYIHKERISGEIWEVEKNDNYWNPELPYLDGVQTYNIAGAPQRAAALESGNIDWADLLDQDGAKRMRGIPGITVNTFPQVGTANTWMNAEEEPFNDARVRKAVHLIIDRHILQNITKELYPSYPGGYVYPRSDFGTDFSDRPGYRTGAAREPDIAEAKRLMAEAYPNGYNEPIDYLVRQGASTLIVAETIQQMLNQGLGLETEIRRSQGAQWIEDARTGAFVLTQGHVISVTDDPSDYFRDWYLGASNYGNWENAEFVALLDQIDKEQDPVKRTALVAEAEAIMDADVPGQIVVDWSMINTAWYSYVKVKPRVFGLYDVHRWQTAWLDK